MSTILARLRSFVDAFTGRDRFEDPLSEELRFHLQAYADDLTARGLSRREAGRRARLHFGGVECVRDECRHARGLRSLDELFHDLKVGARVLLKTPVFSGSAILTIALATGLAMLTFAVVYGRSCDHSPSLVAIGSLLSGPTPSSRHWVCATFVTVRARSLRWPGTRGGG
jgi:hypothetical protein